MSNQFFFEITKNGELIGCRLKQTHGVECENISDLKDLIQFIQ